jgi:hypothetical protein
MIILVLQQLINSLFCSFDVLFARAMSLYNASQNSILQGATTGGRGILLGDTDVEGIEETNI